MSSTCLLGLMSEEEAKDAFQERSVTILPVGSLEQHGPHLPVATDSILAERLSLEIAKAVGAIVLPTINYGNSFSWTEGWMSTISLAQGRLAELVYDIGKAVAKKGCRYFIVVNGHGSNPPDLVIGTKRLKEDCPALEILIIEWWSAGASVIADLKETPSESHSGEFETSIMLSLAPELVRRDLLTAEFAKGIPDLCYEDLIVKRSGDRIKRIQFYDPATSRSGVYGDPLRASAQKGNAIVQRVVENTRRLLRELEEMASRG